jgi:TonB-dependent starch-binding outer membrane protein SusC
MKRIGTLLATTGFAVAMVTTVQAQGGSALAAVPSEGDTNVAALDRPARLVVVDESLSRALTRLYESSGVPVSFSPSRLPADVRVSCSCETVTVREALTRLLDRTALQYREVEGHVLIYEPLAKRPEMKGWPPSLQRGVLVAERTAVTRPGTPHHASLAGTVIDAITGQRIAGARVTVVGTDLVAITDEAGTFRIDGAAWSGGTLRAERRGYRSAERTVQQSRSNIDSNGGDEMRIPIVILGLLALGAPNAALSQQTGSIAGVVTTELDRPLSGAEVSLAGAPQATLTTADGRFMLTGVRVGEHVVRVRFIGYGVTEEVVNVAEGEVAIANFRLRPQALELDRLVVTGYGTQVRRELAGAVASVSGEELTLRGAPTATVSSALQGRAAGVSVVTNSGIPGGGASVRVRGTNSIGANSEPLFVVDGVPATQGTRSDDPTQNPLNTINPNDIESIDILKDASATAIYGARGANGVILITTRRGQPGADQFTWESSYGIQSISKEIPVLNARQYRELRNEALTNVGEPAFYTDLNVPSYDYPSMLLRTAPQQNHSLTFSGGDDRTRYLLSGNFMSQDGIIRGTDFERYSGRINLDRHLNDRLRVGTSLSLARMKMNLSEVETGGLAGDSRGIVAAMIFDPAQAPRDEDGNWVRRGVLAEFITNPLATVTELVNQRNDTRLLWNVFGEFDVIPDLQFRSSLGGTLFDYHSPRYAPKTIHQGFGVGGEANIWQGRTTELLNENLLTYRTSAVGPGSLGLLGGFTVQTNTSNSTSMGAQNFLVDATRWNAMHAGQGTRSLGSGASEWALLSYLTRANYNLFDRYMFTATGRYDGSSRFGTENKWAFFPSASLAWLLSEEGFMQDQTIFSDLKLRTSYGVTGNQPHALYASLAGLGTTEAAIGGVNNVVFVPGSRAPNPDLRWETTRQFNVGMDMGFMENRVTAAFDVYTGRTEDLLLEVNMPFTSGFRTQLRNIGSVENRGAEMELQTVNLETARLSWRSRFNLAANRNKVLSIGEDIEYLLAGGAETNRSWAWAVGGHSHIVKPGHPLGSFYGYQVTGLWQAGDACDLSDPRPTLDCVPGELRFVDLDGDGRISPEDRTIIGNAEPTFYGGFTNSFTFGAFSLDAFMNFSYGNDIINAPNVFALSSSGQLNERVEVLNRWTPTNTNTDIPRANANRRALLHSNLVEDGSFLRLQSLTVGYQLPGRFFPGTNQARVYATGQNLFTITGYSGFDPEVNSLGGDPSTRGVDIGAYPRARVWNFGVSATF